MYIVFGKPIVRDVSYHLSLPAVNCLCLGGGEEGGNYNFFLDFLANSVMGLFRDFGGTHNHRFLFTFEESCNTLP